MTADEIRSKTWKGEQLELEREKVAQLAEINETLKSVLRSDHSGEQVIGITIIGIHSS